MCPSFKRASLLGVVGEETVFFLSAPLEMLFLNEVSISENCVPEMHLRPPKLSFFQLYLNTRHWIAHGGLYWSSSSEACHRVDGRDGFVRTVHHIPFYTL